MPCRRHVTSARTRLIEYQPAISTTSGSVLRIASPIPRRVETHEARGVDSISGLRAAHGDRAIAVDQRHIPFERAVEAHALLLGVRLGRVDDGQRDPRRMRVNVAKPRRVVLNRVRQHRRQPHRSAHAATRSNTVASCCARLRAENASRLRQRHVGSDRRRARRERCAGDRRPRRPGCRAHSHCRTRRRAPLARMPIDRRIETTLLASWNSARTGRRASSAG